MGQAKQRGSRDERVVAAIERERAQHVRAQKMQNIRAAKTLAALAAVAYGLAPGAAR